MLHVTVRSKVERALRAFSTGERYPPDINEVTRTAKLTNYLVPEFPGWEVDAEYNRDIDKTKKLMGDVVKPDVIIHRRHRKRENLLVIEAKPKSRRRGERADKQRLKTFCTDPNYLYEHCAFLLFQLRDQDHPYKIEWLCCHDE
jgi:hypothetical protein